MTLRDLSIEVNGITFPNPFLVGSGPPGLAIHLDADDLIRAAGAETVAVSKPASR